MTTDVGAAPRLAHLQSSVPLDRVLHTGNAGFIVHRSGLIKYEFRAEGLQFGRQLVELINAGDVGYVSVFLYEEVIGVHNRLHWILHLKQPNDYGRLLDKVDHDAKWREITDLDRLPTKGGGGWERIFVEGSISETVMCPQHGVGHADDDDHGDTFQPAARFQTTVPADRLLHSANSALTLHRVGQARYAVRDEARVFLYEWAGAVNEAFVGRATAFLFEEMWGRQDRLHLLIHLSSLDAYEELMEFTESAPGMRALLARQWIPTFKGGGTWEHLFVDGSITDSLLAPARV
ncbi:DUF6039 family protein [Virgisporangium aurantiacum]|uniref:Uncharacterized protein n=1 Tax=Virgisporangium aurantiacum TaxID=175570 RepID=A0A8J3Z1I5_9ACTN|nr:DUF6039 family protein [Virgisporangium aurantiacum]GIJ54797.1 hypothetical protein Vau01_023130 [Virgisporangium aurantiacum]